VSTGPDALKISAGGRILHPLPPARQSSPNNAEEESISARRSDDIRTSGQPPGGLAQGAVVVPPNPPPVGATSIMPPIPFMLPICAAIAASSGGVERVRITGTE